MSIRLAKLSDASSLAAISLEVWLGTYIREGVNAFFAEYALSEFTTARFKTILNDKSETLWVSENSVGIDGYLRITENKPSPATGCSDTEITTLYVQPRHQGQNIGKRLLSQGLSYCATQNIKAPWLAVNAENTRAIEFYQKHGFSDVGETHFHIQDQAYLNRILTYRPS